MENGNGWQSREAASSTLRSCLLTNPPETWIPSPGLDYCNNFAAWWTKATSVVMVTHEPKQHALRYICCVTGNSQKTSVEDIDAAGVATRVQLALG